MMFQPDIQKRKIEQPKKKANPMELKSRILSYVRMNGPVLPVQVSRALGGNTIFAGAVLSELIANKLVLFTKGKIGGSPLYYAPGQESKITMLHDHLSMRPKQAFELLQSNKVLRDKILEPWQRVALRELLDFAIPLDVTIANSTELFWRWYMVKEDEAKHLIFDMLKEEFPELTPPKQIEPVQPPSTTVQQQLPIEVEPSIPIIEPKPIEIEIPKEEHKKKAKEPKIVKSAFRDKMVEFFQEKEIHVLSELPSPKKTEFYFVINLHSSLGDLQYLAIAKSKKKLNEDDIQLAYGLGIEKKLPVMVLAKEIGTKAEKAAKEKGVAIKKL